MKESHSTNGPSLFIRKFRFEPLPGYVGYVADKVMMADASSSALCFLLSGWFHRGVTRVGGVVAAALGNRAK
jgi:hypothetical protein